MATLATKSLTVSRPIQFHYLRDPKRYRNMADQALNRLASGHLHAPEPTPIPLSERKRGRYIAGDSLAPTLAAGFILLAGVMLLFERCGPNYHPARHNLMFIGAITIIGIVGILLMRWAGPIATSMIQDGEYRLLRDTAPWKYIGFVLGGSTMIFCIVSFVEQRVSWRALWIALAAVVGIIVLYDLPFDDILLPPNGDV